MNVQIIKCFLLQRKIILFAFILFAISQSVISQSIFWENGISISSISKETSMKTYTSNLNIDYLHNDWYYLSSGIGYIQKGGDLYIYDINTYLVSSKISNKYVSINTVFNVMKPINNWDLYVGVGPRIDFKINSKATSKDIDVSNSVLLGLKCAVGFNYHFHKFCGGLTLSYLPSLTNFYKDLSKKDKTFIIGFTLGYVI